VGGEQAHSDLAVAHDPLRTVQPPDSEPSSGGSGGRRDGINNGGQRLARTTTTTIALYCRAAGSKCY